MDYIIKFYTDKINTLINERPNYFDNLEEKLNCIFQKRNDNLEIKLDKFLIDFKDLNLDNPELSNLFFEVLLEEYFTCMNLFQELGIGLHTYITNPMGENMDEVISDFQKYFINFYIIHGEIVEIDEFLKKLEGFYGSYDFYCSLINDESVPIMNQVTNGKERKDWEPLTKILFDIQGIQSDSVKDLGINLPNLIANIDVKLLSRGLSRGYNDNNPYINDFRTSTKKLFDDLVKHDLIQIDFDKFLILLTANSENITYHEKIHLDSTRLEVSNKVVGIILNEFKKSFSQNYSYYSFLRKVFIWKKADGSYYDFSDNKLLSNLVNTKK